MNPTTTTNCVISNGRYEIQRFLDKGQFGAVYYGINRNTKNPVAIKIDKQHGILCHEATVMDFLYRGGCLTVPRVCWFGLFKPDGEEPENSPVKTTCLVMEYFPHSLQDYFPPDFARKNALMLQMINICCNIHNLGIIHRDIKPKNFMWSSIEHRWIRLIDFGLATVFNVNDINQPVETYGGGQTGNLRFMSPFVKRGEIPTKRDDLISVGYIYQFISTPENRGENEEKRIQSFLDVCFSIIGHQKPDYGRLKRFFE